MQCDQLLSLSHKHFTTLFGCRRSIGVALISPHTIVTKRAEQCRISKISVSAC